MRYKKSGVGIHAAMTGRSKRCEVVSVYVKFARCDVVCILRMPAVDAARETLDRDRDPCANLHNSRIRSASAAASVDYSVSSNRPQIFHTM